MLAEPMEGSKGHARPTCSVQSGQGASIPPSAPQAFRSALPQTQCRPLGDVCRDTAAREDLSYNKAV